MDETTATSHPVPRDGQPTIDVAPSLGGDALGLGVVMLLVSSVLQRAVGFAREICFCRWLSPEQLGEWDMAFGFLMLAAPLLVMSLPGTFGRYADRYRQGGQLRSFLRRTAGFCAVLTVPSLVAIIVLRGWISYLVFGSREHEGMVVLMAFGLLLIIAYNFLVCVSTSLRNMKVVSLVELANSAVFGVLAIVLLSCGQQSAMAMVVAYAGSSLFCVLGTLAWLARSWRSFPQEPVRLPHRELWSRLLPLAAWIMILNLLWNLFDVVDRYMIVHLLPGSAAEALAEVGNYRSSRVLPLLLSSITSMIAGALLPHLSCDWEAGRRKRVSDQLNLFLKVWAVLLSAGAAAVLFIAPDLFRIGFQNKFSGGLLVLPWTLTYCTWFGLSMLLQTYLWCAERASVASIVAFLGVVINVVLNLLWLPRLGLPGAVLATATANGVAMVLMLGLSSRYGFRAHRGTLVALSLPISIPLGPWGVGGALAVVVFASLISDHYLSRAEKEEIRIGLMQHLSKFRLHRRRAEATP
jgi:polysaccharide transporter, PST family